MSLKEDIQVDLQPKPFFTEDEMDFIRIAKGMPFSWAEYMELNKGGRQKFKDASQREKFEDFLSRFDNASKRYMARTDKRGKDLEKEIVDRLLNGEFFKLTPIGKAILEGRGTAKVKDNDGK